MLFSPSGLISVVISSSMFIIFIWYYLRDLNRISQIGVKSILIIISVIMIRLILPFEFTFTNTVASRYIMTFVLSVLHTPVVHFFNQTFTILQTAFFVWLIGIVFSAVSTIKTRIHFNKVVKQFPVVYNNEVNEIIQTIVKDYKKTVSFQVIYSNFISTPVLYGIISPKIIVPISDLTYQEWYFILKHEISHYYNRDLQIKMLIELLRIIYWWNPFIHLLNYQIDKLLEFRADQKVIKSLNEYEKTQYLDCLLKVAKGISFAPQNYYSVYFNNVKSSVLVQRFHLILGSYKRSKNNFISNLLLIITFSLIVYFSYFVVFEPYAIPPEDVADTVELIDDASYLIINPDGGYDVYMNHTYFASVQEINDSFADLKIYSNLEEVKNYGKNH